jgi:hypothetical protein
MRIALISLIAAGLPLGAYATNSFSTTSGHVPLTRITTTIENATFDGTIWVMNEGHRVQVELATPAIMKKHGLPLSALEIGKTVTLDAFDSPSDNSDRLYARRIVIDGRIIDLRA